MLSRADFLRLKPWWRALQKERAGMLLGWGLMLVTALAGVGLLGVSAWFITACAVTAGALNVFTPGAAIRGFALIRTLARYGERLATHDVVLRVQNRWRLVLFSGLLQQPFTQTDKFRHGHVLQRLTHDLSAMDDLYVRIAAPVSVAVLSAGVVVILGWLWLPAAGALLLLSLLLVSLGVCLYALSGLRAIQSNEFAAIQQLRDSALNTVRGQAERYAWRLGETALATLQNDTARLASATTNGRHSEHRLAVITETLLHTIFLFTLTFALYAMQQGLLSAPLAALLGFIVLGLADSWMLLVTATSSSARVLEAARRLQSDVDSAQNEQNNQQSERLSSVNSTTAPTIYIRHVMIEGREHCPPWSLMLKAGQVSWLHDSSGRGKTSLAYALASQLPLLRGEIDWSHPAQVSMLTQHNTLLSATLADNLCMGAATNAAMDDRALWAVLEAVELADIVENLPERLDTWLGDGGYTLSGGQMRRLCLARALLRPAGLLILDEPFSAIDSEQAARIYQAIQPWLEGKTTLIISHPVIVD